MPSNHPYSIKIRELEDPNFISIEIYASIYSSAQIDQNEFKWLLTEIRKPIVFSESLKSFHEGTLGFRVSKALFANAKDSMVAIMGGLCKLGYLRTENVGEFNEHAKRIINAIAEEAFQASEANFKFMP